MTEASDTLGVQAETKHTPVVPRPEFVQRPLLAADFDGVIVNTLKTLVQIAHRMGKVFPSTVGHTNELTAHGWTADEIDQISNAAYAGDGACYNEPLLGAVDGLKTLEQYFRVVVVTARHGQALVNARIILGNLGLGHLQVVGERHTAAMKASTLGEFGGAFAFVEDSPANLVAALEHTLHAYLVTWPYNTDTWTEQRHMLTELAAHEAWPRLVTSLIQHAGIREEAA